jgi:ADP-ribosyl-[dinitrogen reductase] hydrolase
MSFVPGSELFNSLDVPAGGHLILSAQPAKLGALDPVLASYRAANAKLVVSLLPHDELLAVGLQSMAESCLQSGLTWAHCPIDDFSPPGLLFEKNWKVIAPQVHSLLDQGEGVVLHCRAGLGRTGTVAARILIERGLSAPDAIRLVRQVRPGSIETSSQEDYLQQYAAQSESAQKIFYEAKDGASS